MHADGTLIFKYMPQEYNSKHAKWISVKIFRKCLVQVEPHKG